MGKEKAEVLWTSLSKDVRNDLITLDNCIKEYNFYLFYKAIDEQVHIQFDTATSLLENVQLLRIQFLTCDFARFKSIKLSRQKLIELPAEIGKLSNLEELYLCNNQFTSLPAKIDNFVKLKILDLSHNKLINLPIEIGNFIKLKWLHISNNQLVTLPANIGNLVKLKKLTLDKCQLATLSEETIKLLREHDLKYHCLNII